MREWLEEVGPALDPKLRYEARVGSFLLKMAEREALLSPALDRDEALRLSAFLGHGGQVFALERELAQRLRSGELDGRLAEALVLVLASVVDKLRIVKPAQLDPIHR